MNRISPIYCKLMYFCVEWAKYKQIFDQTPLREEHICLLLISYGLLILSNAQILTEKSPKSMAYRGKF
jgi:hypothetical protein